MPPLPVLEVGVFFRSVGAEHDGGVFEVGSEVCAHGAVFASMGGIVGGHLPGVGPVPGFILADGGYRFGVIVPIIQGVGIDGLSYLFLVVYSQCYFRLAAGVGESREAKGQ